LELYLTRLIEENHSIVVFTLDNLFKGKFQYPFIKITFHIQELSLTFII